VAIYGSLRPPLAERGWSRRSLGHGQQLAGRESSAQARRVNRVRMRWAQVTWARMRSRVQEAQVSERGWRGSDAASGVYCSGSPVSGGKGSERATW